jgi:hypothetical protein
VRARIRALADLHLDGGELGFDVLDLVFRHIFEPHQTRPGFGDGAEQFVQLQVDCLRVSVLGRLDQKDHQEGDDGGARVDDQLLTIFPNLVTIGNDPSKTMSLNYIGLIAPAIRAVQEVEAKCELLEQSTDKRFQDLKAANDNLLSETLDLRRRIKAVNGNYADLRREVEILKRASSC